LSYEARSLFENYRPTPLKVKGELKAYGGRFWGARIHSVVYRSGQGAE